MDTACYARSAAEAFRDNKGRYLNFHGIDHSFNDASDLLSMLVAAVTPTQANWAVLVRPTDDGSISRSSRHTLVVLLRPSYKFLPTRTHEPP